MPKRKPFRKKVKAGALLYAVFIGLLAATVSSMGLLSGYYQSQRYNSFQQTQKALFKLQDGMNLLLSGEKIEDIKRYLPGFFEDGRITASLKSSSWGLYQLAHVEVKEGNNVFEKSALLGTKGLENDYALYLADQSKPLSVCGKTVLKGKCYLPKSGVKRAYIEGQNFVGGDLVQGRILKSEKKLPALSAELLNQNKEYLQLQTSPNDTIADYEVFKETDTLIRSFQQRTLLIHLPHNYLLDGLYLSGNIRILCEGQLTVSSRTVIDGILLYANSIILENDFEGNLQGFARDSIIAEERVMLNYPSTLALLREGQVGFGKLDIQKEAFVNGVVYADGASSSGIKGTNVVLREDATVHGQLFVNGNLDIKGTVLGSVTAEKISLKTNSGTYDNHLLNAEIDREALSVHFAGPLQQEGEKQLVKWM